MTNIVFTKSSSILSKLIRWTMCEPVSHFAICFDDKVVFHSNLLGAHISWLKTFLKKSKIVYSINLNLSLEEEEEIYRSIVDNFDERPYDYIAFFYFCFRAIMFRLFKLPLPKASYIEKKNMYLCTEIAYCLPKRYVPNRSLNITTPYMLYLRIKQEVLSGNIS